MNLKTERLFGIARSSWNCREDVGLYSRMIEQREGEVRNGLSGSNSLWLSLESWWHRRQERSRPNEFLFSASTFGNNLRTKECYQISNLCSLSRDS
jgi:hypothetical protein